MSEVTTKSRVCDCCGKTEVELPARMFEENFKEWGVIYPPQRVNNVTTWSLTVGGSRREDICPACWRDIAEAIRTVKDANALSSPPKEPQS